MRYLLVTLDAAGNWPPERALIRHLAARGHEVHVVSAEAHAGDIEAAGAVYEAYRHAEQRGPVTPREAAETDPLELVARTMLINPQHRAELLTAAERLTPDVVLVDQMLWGAIAATETLSQPTAVLWHTIYGGRGGMRALPPRLLELLNDERAALGLEPTAGVFDQVDRAPAVVAFTLEAFDDVPKPRPANLHYVGPLACLPEPAPDYAWPWPADDARPLVVVSFSTSDMQQQAALQRVADALGALEVRGLLTVGPAMDPTALAIADNVVAETFVPHAAVLPHADLVVTHAGHGTVMAAVTAGVPLLCLPMGRDQFEVTARVTANGLGRRLAQDAPVAAVRAAIEELIADPSLHRRCRRFAEDVDLTAGLRHALEILEDLALGAAKSPAAD